MGNRFWVFSILWFYPIYVFFFSENFGPCYCLLTGFQMTLVVKNQPASAGDIRDVGLIPGSGRFPGGRNGNQVQYSCLENSMDRGAWWATVHGVGKMGPDWAHTVSVHPREVLVSMKVLGRITRVCMRAVMCMCVAYVIERVLNVPLRILTF